MTDSNEDTFDGVSLTESQDSFNENGSSGMGSFIDVSALNEESGFVDTYTEKIVEIQSNTNDTSPRQIDENITDFPESTCIYTDSITIESEYIQNTENLHQQEPFCHSDEQKSTHTLIYSNNSNTLSLNSLVLIDKKEKTADVCVKESLLNLNICGLGHHFSPDVPSDETRYSSIQSMTNYSLDTRVNSPIQPDFLTTTNTESTPFNTTALNHSPFILHPSLEEGKKRYEEVKQISETIMRDISEGKIDIPEMFRENYEHEYISKNVPSTTFKFVAPAKGIFGHYVDLGRLIATGVLGIIGGLIASTFSEVTCNFISIKKTIGNAETTAYMHLGLLKFSSMDSIFTGNQFCVPYHNNYYYMKGPIFAKQASELAILCGYCSMLSLWHYIFTKHTTETWWKIGIYAAVLASLFQFCTFQIFLSEICHKEECNIGVGSLFSGLAGLSYALVTFMMIKNSPVRCITTIDKGSLLRANSKENQEHFV